MDYVNSNYCTCHFCYKNWDENSKHSNNGSYACFCMVFIFYRRRLCKAFCSFIWHPLIAYTTGMERQDDISTNDTTYYKTTKDVVINGKKQEYVKCYTKWIIRIPNIGDMTN